MIVLICVATVGATMKLSGAWVLPWWAVLSPVWIPVVMLGLAALGCAAHEAAEKRRELEFQNALDDVKRKMRNDHDW
jgi:hypothetical protein